MRQTVLYVHWKDASRQSGQVTRDELNPCIEIHSAGIFVQEDEETISIAQDWCQEQEIWRDVQHIPKVNVIRTKRLTLRGLYGQKEWDRG